MQSLEFMHSMSSEIRYKNPRGSCPRKTSQKAEIKHLIVDRNF